MDRNRATLIGLLAILLWSSMVGMIRIVSDYFGALGGAAMIYSLATIFLIFTIGMTKFRGFPNRYLIWGAILFVSYELCLALAIGYAKTPKQAIEAGMVNYLWPTFTIIASVLFNKQKATWLLIPGVILSLVGITWVLGGDEGFDIAGMAANIQSDPLSYILAFTGAIIWSGYCVVTARLAKGHNGVTIFFLLVSLSLWLQYLMQYGVSFSAFTLSWQAVLSLIVASSALGFGYAAWNIGILHGNVLTLATASYFTPIFSALFASMVLGEILAFSFWQGVILVCIGSTCCFVSTRNARFKGAKSV